MTRPVGDFHTLHVKDMRAASALVLVPAVPAADTVPRSSRGWDGGKRTNGVKRAEYAPRLIVTDELDSYRVAHRELIASVEHRR
jgi:hypothetical protein